MANLPRPIGAALSVVDAPTYRDRLIEAKRHLGGFTGRIGIHGRGSDDLPGR